VALNGYDTRAANDGELEDGFELLGFVEDGVELLGLLEEGLEVGLL
jgi:hypothetical protein